MSEGNIPPVSSDDSPTIALQEQWAAERKRLQKLVSWTVTRPPFDPGKVPDPPIIASITGSADPDPRDLLPTLLMKTLVSFGSRTDDGILIQAIAAPWRTILKLIKDDPNLIYQIDPWKWEEIIAGSYQASGHFDEVVLTPRSGDHGRDVIATKHGFCSIRCIESVKRYTPGKVVTAEDVRSLGFAVMSDPTVSKGVISTTWEFAPRIEDDPNIKSLLPHRIELVNRDALIKRFAAWGPPDSRASSPAETLSRGLGSENDFQN
jgi:restriction system protein